MKKEDLALMNVEQLRTVLDNIGVEYHHKAGAPKLVEMIMNAQAPAVEVPRLGAAPKLGEEVEHTATQNLKPIRAVNVKDYPSPEELHEALIPYTQRGLEIVQLDDEFYHFRHGNREDSGNMKQSLQRIVITASRLV